MELWIRFEEEDRLDPSLKQIVLTEDTVVVAAAQLVSCLLPHPVLVLCRVVDLTSIDLGDTISSEEADPRGIGVGCDLS